MLNKSKVFANNMYRKKTGHQGEEIAKKFLKQLGYQILQQNYTIRGGEIDIVALDGETVVFVEVKTRSSHDYGLPEESLSYFKLKALQRTAQLYMTMMGFDSRSYRFDLVTVDYTERNDKPEIKHLENIIN